MIYILNLTTALIYFLADNPNIYILSEVQYFFASMVFRCMVIAVKYSTFSPQKVKYLKENYLSMKDLMKDIYLGDWSLQTDEMLYEEIHFSLRKYDQDNAMFFI